MTLTEKQNYKNEILDILRLGECFLVYYKLNGDVRVASGTLKRDLIPPEFLPKSEISSPLDQTEKNIEYSGLVHYFDLGSKGWRNFYMENLKSISLREILYA